MTNTYLPMKMEQTECSETSAYKIQTPVNYVGEICFHSFSGSSLLRHGQLYTTLIFGSRGRVPVMVLERVSSRSSVELSL